MAALRTRTQVKFEVQLHQQSASQQSVVKVSGLGLGREQQSF